MVDTKISNELAAGPLDGTELTEIVQSGSNRKTTTLNLANLAFVPSGTTGSGAIVRASNPSVSLTATGGNTAATLAARFGHNLNVIDDFNAKGDGSTDDRVTLQAASTAIGTGGSVFVPNTNAAYMVGGNGVDQIVAGQSWFFAPGAVFKKKSGVDNSVLKLNAPNISVFNATFDGNASGGITSPPVNVAGDGAYLSNVTIKNAGQWGFYATDVSDLTVDGLRVINTATQEPVFVRTLALPTQTININLRHLFIDQSALTSSWTAPAVFVEGLAGHVTQRVIIDDLMVTLPLNPVASDPAALVTESINNATVSNIVSFGGSMGISTASCTSTTFSNISAIDFSYYGIECVGDSRCTFSGLTLSGGPCYFGIAVQGDLNHRITITDFTIEGLGNATPVSAGIFLQSADSVVIGPGYIDAMAVSGFSGFNYGIYSAAQNNISISNVIIEGDNGSGGKKADALIELDYCSSIHIVGGALNNSGGYAINIASDPRVAGPPDNILISGVSGGGHTSGFINLQSVDGGTFGSNIRVIDCEAFTADGFPANALDLASNVLEVWGRFTSPEGVVTAGVGSIFHRLDGIGGWPILYVKESGTGNTGWVGK
jgi:hypothetical protein